MIHIIKSKEYVLSVNKFEKPKELTEYDAVCMYVMRLLLLDPGTIQSKPEMGVGLVSKWRYSDSENNDELRIEIERQVAQYLPMYQLNNIHLSTVKKELLIEMTLNDVIYSFITDNGTLKLYQV